MELSLQTVKFGRLPRPPGHDVLFFQDYVSFRKSMPAPPPSASWSRKIQSWPMMANDRYGDCVEAGKGHQVMIFSAYGGGVLKTPTDAEITATYFKETGGPDSGLNIPHSLNYWTKNPLAGDVLDAWSSVDPQNLSVVQLVIALFGGITLGLDLPNNVFDAINAGKPWTDVSQPPNPKMGHGFILTDYDASGPTCVTWGRLQKMTWAWYQRYTTEAYMLLGHDWESNNMTPGGISLADLRLDFQALANGQSPPTPIPLAVRVKTAVDAGIKLGLKEALAKLGTSPTLPMKALDTALPLLIMECNREVDAVIPL